MILHTTGRRPAVGRRVQKREPRKDIARVHDTIAAASPDWRSTTAARIGPIDPP